MVRLPQQLRKQKAALRLVMQQLQVEEEEAAAVVVVAEGLGIVEVGIGTKEIKGKKVEMKPLRQQTRGRIPK